MFVLTWNMHRYYGLLTSWIISSCLRISSTNFFVRYRLRDPMPMTWHEYRSALQRHNFLTLEKLRILYDLRLMYKLVNSTISCLEILSLLCLSVPFEMKFDIFHAQFHRMNYGKYNYVNHLCIFIQRIFSRHWYFL